MKTRIVIAGVIACTSFGCADEVPPGWRIERPRVLGMRVEVVGDERRATPAPGESFRIRWLIATPRRAPEPAYHFAACPAAPENGTVPRCAAAAFGVSNGAGPVPGGDFRVPSGEVAERLLVTGAVCTNGMPVVDDDIATGCEGDLQDASLVTAHVVSDLATSNANPEFAPNIELDGAPWTTDTGPCPSADLRTVPADGSSHRIRVRARGTVDVMDGAEEELQLSQFATAGVLESQFSFADANDANEFEIEWEAPDTTDDGVTRVRFWFVLRDMRGGVAWEERTLCATEEEER